MNLDEILREAEEEAKRDPNGTTPVDLDAAVKAAEKRASISQWEAAGRGALQGAMFNSHDELAGLIDALRATPSSWGDAKAAYRKGRDESRENHELAREEHPKTYVAADIAGGALASLAPGLGAARTLRGAVKLGAKMGAGYGVGSTDDITDLPRVAADVGQGVVTGAAGGALGHGLAKGAGAVGERLRQVADKADEARVMTAQGAHGGSIKAPKIVAEAERVPGGIPEMARIMRETGMAPKLGTTEKVQAAAQLSKKEAEEIIEGVIARVDDALPDNQVDIPGVVEALRAEASRVNFRDPTQNGVAQHLLKAADEIEAAYKVARPAEWQRAYGVPPTEAIDNATMRQAQKLASNYGGRVDWRKIMSGEATTDQKEAYATVTRAIREKMDETADRVLVGATPEMNAAPAVFGKGKFPADALEGYKRARRVWQVANAVDDVADESISRSITNNKGITLGDMAAFAAARQGGMSNAVAGGFAVARNALTPFGASTRATKAEAIRALLDSPSGLAALPRKTLERVVPRLQAAAAAGGHALVAEHYRLAREIPEYRTMAAESGDPTPTALRALLADTTER